MWCKCELFVYLAEDINLDQESKERVAVSLFETVVPLAAKYEDGLSIHVDITDSPTFGVEVVSEGVSAIDDLKQAAGKWMSDFGREVFDGPAIQENWDGIPEIRVWRWRDDNTWTTDPEVWDTRIYRKEETDVY